MVFMVAQLVKNPPAMQETWIQSLGWEDPLEKKATYSSILTWRIPWTVLSTGLQSWTQLGNFHFGIRKTTFTHSSEQGGSCL